MIAGLNAHSSSPEKTISVLKNFALSFDDVRWECLLADGHFQHNKALLLLAFFFFIFLAVVKRAEHYKAQEDAANLFI